MTKREYGILPITVNEVFLPVSVEDSFEYFVTIVGKVQKRYRLVWLTEFGKNYVGVLTAFRDRKVENDIKRKKKWAL